MDIGAQVQLKVAYDESWSSGFEIAEVMEGGYQIRRRSDGRLLPSPTGDGDVRLDETDAPKPW